MKTAFIFLFALFLSACNSTLFMERKDAPAAMPIPAARQAAENPSPVSRNPLIGTGGTFYYGYRVHGDPAVAPQQAFSDEKLLYLQFPRDAKLPVAMTRTGKIIEYDVRNNLVILPKFPSIVLRIGPRRAYVDREDIEVIRISNEISAPLPTEEEPVGTIQVSRGDARASEQVQVVEVPPGRDGAWVVARLGAQQIALHEWEVCRGNTVRSYLRAKAVRDALRAVPPAKDRAFLKACGPGVKVATRRH